MTACKSLSSTGHKPNWKLTLHDGTVVEGDWRAESPFGSVESAVVVNPDGSPNFDRPLYREAPNVNCVVYAVDVSGEAKFAVIRQPRPHADHPEKTGDDHEPVVFGQIVMGFLERVIGKDLVERYESVSAGAAREAHEEAGANVVLSIEYPSAPYHNPNPTFVATWSNLVFVKVDLDAIEALKHDRKEPIFSAEYIGGAELLERVRSGWDDKGACYRMCTANSAWFTFFATHPELWPR